MTLKSKTLLVISALLITATIASANPQKYGEAIYSEVANRIAFDSSDSAIDSDAVLAVHSTLLDPFTGMGQENKL